MVHGVADQSARNGLPQVSLDSAIVITLVMYVGRLCFPDHSYWSVPARKSVKVSAKFCHKQLMATSDSEVSRYVIDHYLSLHEETDLIFAVVVSTLLV